MTGSNFDEMINCKTLSVQLSLTVSNLCLPNPNVSSTSFISSSSTSSSTLPNPNVSSTSFISSSSTSSSDSCMVESIKLIVRNAAKDIKSEISKCKSNQASMLDSFRCLICLENKPSKFRVCYHCGRYLGCYECIIKIDKCPICRKSFSCTACGEALPKTPVIVPGLFAAEDNDEDDTSDDEEN